MSAAAPAPAAVPTAAENAVALASDAAAAAAAAAALASAAAAAADAAAVAAAAATPPAGAVAAPAAAVAAPAAAAPAPAAAVAAAAAPAAASAAGKQDVPPGWPLPIDREAEMQEITETGEQLRASLAKTKRLRVYMCTWNMQGRPPPADIRHMLMYRKCHVYCFGTVECERTIAQSALNTSKTRWIAFLRSQVGEDYEMLRSHTLQAINLLVFVHKALLPWVSGVGSAAVATGIKAAGQQMGNKGAVGMAFCVGLTSFCALSCHFHAHHGKIEARNNDYWRIERELKLHPPFGDNVAAETTTERFDHCFWMGDFNYRINGSKTMVEGLIQRGQHAVLQQNDQLGNEIKKKKVFVGLKEPPLNFLPTYKFDRGTDNYDTSAKRRIPSWTDRVFYKPVPGIELLAYKSITSVRTSDHRPVVACVDVPFTPPAARAKAQQANTPTGVSQSEVCVVS